MAFVHILHSDIFFLFSFSCSCDLFASISQSR
uniref:Uncharacterized protein n=1 Tax=Arundo donax TaxID=35708 RepID=A0A0A8YF36_ARUDO